MKDVDKPAPVTFKKLKTTKSDISGVGKVGNCALLLHTHHAVLSGVVWQPAALLHLPTLYAKSTGTKHTCIKQPVCACNANSDSHATYHHMGSLTAEVWPYACIIAHGIICLTSVAA